MTAYQITEQASGQYSVYTDSGSDVSMADEKLIRFDIESYDEAEAVCILEYLRGELRAERISYGELHELQSLAQHIDAGDVELLEAAGVPESV